MEKTNHTELLESKMSPEMIGLGMADPHPLTGTRISKFATSHDLHLIELGMALGVNTAALYTRKGAGSLNSSLSMLLRLFSAFPEHLPKYQTPDAEELILKISAIDPSFKPTFLGPLLGLEKNSSTRLKKDGIGGSSPTVRSLAQLINILITEDPQNWFVIKAVIETEAKARKIVPAEKIWLRGGWNTSGKKKDGQKPSSAQEKAAPTDRKLIRRGK